MYYILLQMPSKFCKIYLKNIWEANFWASGNHFEKSEINKLKRRVRERVNKLKLAINLLSSIKIADSASNWVIVN